MMASVAGIPETLRRVDRGQIAACQGVFWLVLVLACQSTAAREPTLRECEALQVKADNEGKVANALNSVALYLPDPSALTLPAQAGAAHVPSDPIDLWLVKASVGPNFQSGKQAVKNAVKAMFIAWVGFKEPKGQLKIESIVRDPNAAAREQCIAAEHQFNKRVFGREGARRIDKGYQEAFDQKTKWKSAQKTAGGVHSSFEGLVGAQAPVYEVDPHFGRPLRFSEAVAQIVRLAHEQKRYGCYTESCLKSLIERNLSEILTLAAWATPNFPADMEAAHVTLKDLVQSPQLGGFCGIPAVVWAPPKKDKVIDRCLDEPFDLDDLASPTGKPDDVFFPASDLQSSGLQYWPPAPLARNKPLPGVATSAAELLVEDAATYIQAQEGPKGLGALDRCRRRDGRIWTQKDYGFRTADMAAPCHLRPIEYQDGCMLKLPKHKAAAKPKADTATHCMAMPTEYIFSCMETAANTRDRACAAKPNILSRIEYSPNCSLDPRTGALICLDLESVQNTPLSLAECRAKLCGNLVQDFMAGLLRRPESTPDDYVPTDYGPKTITTTPPAPVAASNRPKDSPKPSDDTAQDKAKEDREARETAKRLKDAELRNKITVAATGAVAPDKLVVTSGYRDANSPLASKAHAQYGAIDVSVRKEGQLIRPTDRQSMARQISAGMPTDGGAKAITVLVEENLKDLPCINVCAHPTDPIHDAPIVSGQHGDTKSGEKAWGVERRISVYKDGKLDHVEYDSKKLPTHIHVQMSGSAYRRLYPELWD